MCAGHIFRVEEGMKARTAYPENAPNRHPGEGGNPRFWTVEFLPGTLRHSVK